MKNITIWFKVFLTTILISAPVSYSVLIKERIKKNAVIDQDIAYYNEVQTNLSNFQKAQVALMAERSLKNKQNMENTKIAYEDLLKQQAAIVKDHSQYVPVTQTESAQNSTSTPSSSTSSSSKSTTTTSSTPKVTRTTKTS
jgi:hypothetical protein